MKSVGDLTGVESLKLQLAQVVLQEAALRYSFKKNTDNANYLFTVAREFDAACREIGFDNYWIQAKPVDTGMKTFDGPFPVDSNPNIKDDIRFK